MEDLPEALLGEIIKQLPTTSDLNSLSLVSKRLYTVEAELRDAIYVGCGVCPVTVVKVIGCSSLRGGGGELGSNKNLDLWLQLVCTKLKLKHAI